MNNQQIWSDALESIKVSVSDAIFSTWFSQTHLASIKENEDRYLVEVGCNSSFVKSTIESRYYGMVQDTLSKLLENPCDLAFIVKTNIENNSSTNELFPLFDKKETSQEITQKLSNSNIRTTLTFQNFAVSSSNQMAWAAAEAVTENLGNAYNPLFIWGGVGVGKTHLMNAIGHEIIKQNPESKILNCSGEQFTNDIVEGIRNKTTQAFRSKYRKLKLLMVDDIQFIAGKDAVQEEFFHTFNTLVNYGSQIILTSDRPPHEIAKLEERLRSRFEAGLIVDIAPPDFELRCAITQIKAQEKGIDIEMEMVQTIAGNLHSARQIEGYLVRLLSESKLKKLPVTEELVERLLSKGDESVSARPAKKVQPNDLISAVSDYYSLGKRKLLGKSRAQKIARPRQVLMYLMRTHLTLPYQEVGRIIGGRDHTTVMHAVDKITSLASEDVDIRQDIRGIKNLL